MKARCQVGTTMQGSALRRRTTQGGGKSPRADPWNLFVARDFIITVHPYNKLYEPSNQMR